MSSFNSRINSDLSLSRLGKSKGAASLDNNGKLNVNQLPGIIDIMQNETQVIKRDLVTFASNYGAIGNGVTDDTVAIQNALNAAGTLLDTNQNSGLSGRSVCQLNGGTYKITAPLIVKNGTVLRGETSAPPYPNRLSGFRSNSNMFTGTEIVCDVNFVGEHAVILEPDNTNLENVILDGHSLNCGTTWTQVNVTTAQGRWISTAFIKFPVQDSADKRIQSFKFDNVEIPYFRVGEYMEFQLQAIGGSGAYTFSLSSGALPQGLSLSSSGLISGTATQLEVLYPNFNINDGSNNFSRVFTVGTIIDEIKTRDVLPATVGAAYSFQLETWNNVAGLTWKSGTVFPDWLSISPSGLLTNNRTLVNDDVEFFEFKVELYSGSNLLDRRNIKTEVRYADGAISIFGEQRVKPEAGVAFSYQYKGHGGYGAYVWSINVARSAIAGNATAVTATSPFIGLTLNVNTGTISGTPTTTGTNQYYLRCTSTVNSNIYFEGLFYIETLVAGQTPKILTRSFATAAKNQAYSFQFNVENIPAAKPYSYTAIGLPSGLSMDSVTGLISGTPTGANFVNGVRIQWSDSVKDCTIRGFRSGGGIYSSNSPSNVHRISGCLISVCDAGIKNVAQMYDSHFTDLYIFNCRVGLDLGDGSAGLTFSDCRIEYIHEDGINMRRSNENDFSSIYFDTCGWSSIRADGCRNLIVSNSRFFRSGRNLRGIGTKLNPKANRDYSNHVYLDDCPRATFTGNSFDVGTKDGGDGIYLSDHFADNVRPYIGFRLHNCPELTIVGNNLTGQVAYAFDANLSDFGENKWSGYNLANNVQSDKELVPLSTILNTQQMYIPNANFQIWQRDISFSVPAPTEASTTDFQVADGWTLKRGGNSAINQTTLVSRGTDGKYGEGYYLHIEKPANTTVGTTQTLELYNQLVTKLEHTSNRAIVLSYYAKSSNGTSLTARVSQYPASADNSFAAYPFEDNARTIGSKWKRYQHYFELADLNTIKAGSGATFTVTFKLKDSLANINLDLTGVQIDFVDQSPFAQDLRVVSFENELKFAQLRYQKSKAYNQYFPSWSNNYRYDVNGANWQPGFINRVSFGTTGNCLLADVVFDSEVLTVPAIGLKASWDKLKLLNPNQLVNIASSARNNWTAATEVASYIEHSSKTGFSISARGATLINNTSYSIHWLYSFWD